MKRTRDINPLLFLLGLLIGGLPVALANPSITKTYKKLRVFAEVLTHIERNYVDAVDPEALVYDGVSGLLQNLDPHSTFMRAQNFQKLREDTAGTFGGIGITANHVSGRGIRISEIADDGPAHRAGLQNGDLILAADDVSFSKMHMQEILNVLRGVPGTKVVLKVIRKTWRQPRKIPLVRRHVRVTSIEKQLLQNEIGYIRIQSFQERTSYELGEALRDLRKSLIPPRKELRGLVLDLRDNPGGLFDEGIRVADRFLKKGIIVTTKGRNPDNNEVDEAHPRGTEKDYPVVVLVNRGSASASEIVAGALQDHRRAKLLGTRTYGKGSVQSLFGLADGSGLKLTVAKYFTPSGRSIDRKGIEPDIRVTSKGKANGDAQLEAAVRQLR